MAYMHIGKDFTPPDVPGKVTGRIKYAEDYTREGMVYARLLTSPIPHARVLDIDASAALAMDGVIGILTADDVYPDGEPQSTGLKILTNEPTLVGEPILALAAVDEKTAESAIAQISVTFERLPFVLDPLDSLQPGGADAYNGGNTFVFRQGFVEEKWTADQVASFRAGNEPTAEPQQTVEYGDLDAAFGESSYVYEGTFTNAGYPHHSMEPRSALAYWQDGKLYLHGGSQSLTAFADGIAGIIGVPKEDLVFVNAATGGGFGQRARAGSIPVYAVPAKLSQKINRPVMMRATREEEFTFGGARQGLTGWIKVGFKPDGVMAACDLWIVSDNGGKGGGADAYSAADCISVLYQADAVRFRGTAIGTNTAHRGAQRGPGQNQIAPIISPILDVAADELGVSRLDIRKINAAMTGDVGGPQRTPFTSAYMPEALEQAAAEFDWEGRQSRRRQTNGSKVIGLGIGQGYHNAGRSGMDGIVMMGADGRLKIHNGVGNLGTYSYASTSRAAAEVLQMPWRVHQIADESVGYSYAEVAQRAIELGGKYTGSAELPEELAEWTQIAVSRLEGTGFMGIFHDPRHEGNPPGFTVTACEIELDKETGKIDILEMISIGEAGTIMHPKGMDNQLVGGAVWGIGLSAYERHLYDPQNGLPASTGYWQSKVPTYLDTPVKIETGWVDLPDPENPVGARGIGEPSMGSVSAALTAAITDALDGHIFGASPITADMIINHVAGTSEEAVPLAQNNFRG